MWDVSFTITNETRDDDNYYTSEVEHCSILVNEKGDIVKDIITELKHNDQLDYIIDSYAHEFTSHDYGCYTVEITNIALCVSDAPSINIENDPAFLKLINDRKDSIKTQYIVNAKQVQEKKRQKDLKLLKELKEKYGDV